MKINQILIEKITNKAKIQIKKFKLTFKKYFLNRISKPFKKRVLANYFLIVIFQ